MPGVQRAGFPHHAVPEPERRHRELHRDGVGNVRGRGVLAPRGPERGGVIQDAGQEIVQDKPLVMPRHEPSRLLEGVRTAPQHGGEGAGGESGRHEVVERQEHRGELRDEQVLVVAGVVQVRGPVLTPGQVAGVAARPGRPEAEAAGRIVEGRRRGRTVVVEVLQVESRGVEIGDGGRRRTGADRRAVTCQVVTDELPEEGIPQRERALCPVVRPDHRAAQFDQRRIVPRECCQRWKKARKMGVGICRRRHW